MYINLKSLKQSKLKLDKQYVRHRHQANMRQLLKSNYLLTWVCNLQWNHHYNTNYLWVSFPDLCFACFQSLCISSVGHIFVCSYHTHKCVHASMSACIQAVKTLSQHLQRVMAERAHARRKKNKNTKATISPSAWTCRLCGLVSPRSQPTPSPSPPTFFPLLSNFQYSHRSITLNGCQSLGPAVGLKQSLF